MNFPDELQYTAEHVWVETDGDTARVGITEYILDQMGEVFYVGPQNAGAELAAGEAFTTIEFSEGAAVFSSPLSGDVIAVNEDLEDSPELISEDPYKAWIVELRFADRKEKDALWSASEYEEHL